MAAYLFVTNLAAGKTVLDAGCGEGFGTHRLTAVAAKVVGVDYAEDAIAYCREHWSKANLSFRVADLTAPGPWSETFDLVLNFQVLEHISDEVAFLEGLRARLSSSGTLVLTTPNRLQSFSENPYHLREYAPAELERLLSRVFTTVELAGMHGNAKVREFDRRRERAVKRILRLDPLGLRHRLPAWLVEAAFARLARVVRRSARKGAAGDAISPSDFRVRDDAIDEALDLVAVCRT